MLPALVNSNPTVKSFIAVAWISLAGCSPSDPVAFDGTYGFNFVEGLANGECDVEPSLQFFQVKVETDAGRYISADFVGSSGASIGGGTLDTSISAFDEEDVTFQFKFTELMTAGGSRLNGELLLDGVAFDLNFSGAAYWSQPDENCILRNFSFSGHLEQTD